MLLAIGHCSALHHQDRPPMCADSWTDGKSRFIPR
ncbi:DEHA2F08778p [Debaryomyces hansenii CBS767]|uniref:DEHA2F08778p n=1 Tax=Debaryomyces hansenii (strain ATCC 36239 / CBS 767 / BCRC 21394 / JCM 1990 / NBRC 0083 / IGC 2968) TaxID=284592 RepID=W0TYT2_DEBHA|nr:DEHA2F08778p [Debaryomyces hansenii CBS767]CAG89084.2 DEHA2F08778p [Debaryomyces hansenii CBS767]|eukprot:XP_002770779.1 DEHA2F08778p [Debaryomyces hansenii CBS767]